MTDTTLSQHCLVLVSIALSDEVQGCHRVASFALIEFSGLLLMPLGERVL